VHRIGLIRCQPPFSAVAFVKVRGLSSRPAAPHRRATLHAGDGGPASGQLFSKRTGAAFSAGLGRRYERAAFPASGRQHRFVLLWFGKALGRFPPGAQLLGAGPLPDSKGGLFF